MVVSLQETLEAGKEDSALTLSDVLQDGFCMEDACERQDEARRLRRLIEGLPARERKLILLRYGLAGQPPRTAAKNGTAAPDQQKLCLKARDPRTGSVAQRLASGITGRIKGAACVRRIYPLLAALRSNVPVTRIFSPRSFRVLRRAGACTKGSGIYTVRRQHKRLPDSFSPQYRRCTVQCVPGPCRFARHAPSD